MFFSLPPGQRQLPSEFPEFALQRMWFRGRRGIYESLLVIGWAIWRAPPQGSEALPTVSRSA
jgi:hypothetical protein